MGLLKWVGGNSFLAVAVTAGFSGNVTAEANANQVIAATGAVFTYLLDTGIASPAPLPTATMDEKLGWKVLEENDTTHRFTGDAVLLNDRITVVLRRGGTGAEVYARNDSGHVYRALLAPRLAGNDSVKRLVSYEILENHAGAVTVGARFETEEGRLVALDYRVTTGQILVEMRPKEGIEALLVRVRTRYVVAPEFFGDDLVFGPPVLSRRRTAIPAENFYLHLVEGGGALVSCLWESANAWLIASEGVIDGSELECTPGHLIWVGILEGAEVWHEAALTQPGAAQSLAWTPSFPARWRVDLLRKSELTTSRDFDGQVELGLMDFSSSTSTAVIYPLDRTQATPLNIYCLVDLMRATLGMGVCQYILDLEGLDAETSPTPALVMDWVEREFERNRAGRHADVIRDRLVLMANHTRDIEERIAAYGGFAKEIRRAVESANGLNGLKQDIARILDELEGVVAPGDPHSKASEASAALAEQIAGLLSQANAYEECRGLGNELRSIGAAQDRTLTKCRMHVRRLKQYCLTISQDRPDPVLKTILARVAEFLEGQQRSGG